jgi:hypothetical protein
LKCTAFCIIKVSSAGSKSNPKRKPEETGGELSALLEPHDTATQIVVVISTVVSNSIQIKEIEFVVYYSNLNYSSLKRTLTLR